MIFSKKTSNTAKLQIKIFDFRLIMYQSLHRFTKKCLLKLKSHVQSKRVKID